MLISLVNTKFFSPFNLYLCQVFAPHIVSYLEKEESTLREELEDALERETWLNENCTEVVRTKNSLVFKF